MNSTTAPICLLAAMLLAACAGTSTPSGSGSSKSGTIAPPPNEALRTEQRWLQDWFKGTPVVVVLDRGALRVEVPLRYSFDTGSAAVKEPLSAVLVRVATSMRRQPMARLHLVAPRDATGDGSNALDRGDSVTDKLVSLGIGPQRIASVIVGPPTAVQLRLEMPPAP